MPLRNHPSIVSSQHRRRKAGRPVGRMVSIAAALLGLTALTGIGVMQLSGGEKPDHSGCYARQDQHHSAIFIDNSLVQLSPAHLRDYQAAFMQAYEVMPANGRLSVFTTATGSNGSLGEPVFEACKPAATPEEQAAIGAPDKPTPYLARQAADAHAQYLAGVHQILADVQNPAKVAPDSPILEQLRAISMRGSFNHLSVITDGLQNSRMGSFCQTQGDMPSFAAFRTRSDYALEIAPRLLAGTAVRLLIVEHGELPSTVLPYCSNHELKQWWHDYFTANGAASVELQTLRYWGGM